MIEQLDRILRATIGIFVLVSMTIIIFKQLKTKYSNRASSRLFLSTVLVLLFVILPPLLIFMLAAILLSDPESWLGALLPYALVFVSSYVTYKVAERLFLK